MCFFYAQKQSEMTIQKIYLPGSEWLYFRIYTGHHTADHIITQLLAPLAGHLIEQGQAESWFFIRYADPDHHLRFRIRLTARDRMNGIMEKLSRMVEDYVSQGLVWKVDVSTYRPEVDRYGKQSVGHAEKIFYADSDAYVRYKEYESGRSDADLPWLYALASADKYLSDFTYSNEQRKELLLGLSRNFGKEFSKNKHLAKQISSKYRIHRKRIDQLLDISDVCSSDMGLIKILDQRSNQSAGAVRAILELYAEGKMEVPMNDLLSSFIHMTMNRIFQNNNRLHEMVLYDFLFRHYKSLMARQIAY
jgi:thiopeptide-type bacteriocin biosynthesis protein